jgi:hypothetical protein
MEPQQMTYLAPRNQPEQGSRGLQMVEAKSRKFRQKTRSAFLIDTCGASIWYSEQLAILVG